MPSQATWDVPWAKTWYPHPTCFGPGVSIPTWMCPAAEFCTPAHSWGTQVSPRTCQHQTWPPGRLTPALVPNSSLNSQDALEKLSLKDTGLSVSQPPCRGLGPSMCHTGPEKVTWGDPELSLGSCALGKPILPLENSASSFLRLLPCRVTF